MTNDIRRIYPRPVPCPIGHPGARPLAGGLFGFAMVELLRRGAAPEVLPIDAAVALYPDEIDTFRRLSQPCAPLAGLDLSSPKVMGVVNVTPDSFSDGGLLEDARAAVAHGLGLAEAGADILDIGGESTRPGAQPVPIEEELTRVMPVIEGLIDAGCEVPISIDTRKAKVAEAAIAAGAVLFNDVSALTYDRASAEAAARAPALCLMHAQGDPRTMQENPQYGDVLLDVYDFLELRIAAAEAEGVAPGRIVIDPGIGFGKTLDHNLALIRRLSLFHGLGCPILLGVSRKRFIGTLSGADQARERVHGSIAAGLAGLDQGAQILRVHDVAETRQAIDVWRAIVREGKMDRVRELNEATQ
ncbi:MAG: dihydropteroate synthase [Paracoccaceae bacterium]|nr:dihydropteroate synthase [Paracoccaceae bacterium]